MNNKNSNIEKSVKKLLANQMGAEPEDIELNNSLTDDLMITPADLSELIETLTSKGFDMEKIDITEIETVQELVEALSAQKLVN